jgi:IS30 family transposase
MTAGAAARLLRPQWSPEQMFRCRKRIEGGMEQQSGLSVSHEAIHTAIYALPGGARGASAIGTLVEHSPCFVALMRIPAPKADVAACAFAGVRNAIPAPLRKTLTCGQGKEMAEHRATCSPAQRINPTLERRCSDCVGPHRVSHELRIATAQSWAISNEYAETTDWRGRFRPLW